MRCCNIIASVAKCQQLLGCTKSCLSQRVEYLKSGGLSQCILYTIQYGNCNNHWHDYTWTFCKASMITADLSRVINVHTFIKQKCMNRRPCEIGFFILVMLSHLRWWLTVLSYCSFFQLLSLILSWIFFHWFDNQFHLQPPQDLRAIHMFLSTISASIGGLVFLLVSIMKMCSRLKVVVPDDGKMWISLYLFSWFLVMSILGWIGIFICARTDYIISNTKICLWCIFDHSHHQFTDVFYHTCCNRCSMSRSLLWVC